MLTGFDIQSRSILPAAIALAALALAGAWVFEVGFGYAPCKLCLMQRWPYYIGLPVGIAAWLAGGSRTMAGRVLMVLFGLIFVVSIGMGIYHAGVEWKFWAGPTDCGGRIVDSPASITDFRKSLQTARVVSCTDAALRVLGLSFAGWNAVVSAVVAGLAYAGVRQAHGSSSVSQ